VLAREGTRQGVFYLVSGSTNVPLYSVLSSMGISDSQMSDAWGRDVMEASKGASKPQDMTTLFRKMRPRAPVPAAPEELHASVHAYFASKAQDPDVAKITLGKSFENISPDLIFETSKKIIALANEQAEPDDRESLAFKRVRAFDDIVIERLAKARPAIERILQRAADSPRVTRAA
jgi:DNA-directed RNA polymerase beta subunit